MSKLQASSVRQSVKTLLAQSSLETHKEAGGKKRNFIETVELQIGLKNYDPQRDKRFVCLSRSSIKEGKGQVTGEVMTKEKGGTGKRMGRASE